MKTYAIVAAEAQPPAGSDQRKPQGSPWTMFILLGGMILIFYLLLIRPQQKRQKEAERRKQEMLANLRKNDHVVTIGGIHGVVTGIGEDEITIRIDDKTDARMRVARDAISRVITGEEKGGKGEASE